MSLQEIPFHRWDAQRAALIIAHPGHELRIYHWLERARPLVLVLTDGSGHTNHSRLGSTTAVLEKAGAVAGSIYGRVSDQELYRAILSRDADFFIALVEEIAQILRRESTEYVVGDAVEGANPGHDVCRLLLNAALSLESNRRTTVGRVILNFRSKGRLTTDAPRSTPTPSCCILMTRRITVNLRRLNFIRRLPPTSRGP